jgi:hypothetical protein
MFVNTNTTSIQKASKSYSLLRKYSDDLHVEFSVEKNMFKVVYLYIDFRDGGDYSEDRTEYFYIDKEKLNSIVRFHVGLMLPKTKGRIVGKVALDVISKMKCEYDHKEVEYYGDYEEFNRYAINISDFIEIVKNSVHIQEQLKQTEEFINSHH